MKNMVFSLIVMLMSISMSAFGGTTTSQSQSANSATAITIPTNIIVKQTIVMKSGQSIVVYYQKAGNVCKVFSKTDVTKYKEADLNNVKSTTFELADQVEGKCYATRKTTDVIALARSFLNKQK